MTLEIMEENKDELKKYIKDLHEIILLKLDIIEMEIKKMERKIDGKTTH